MRTKCSGNQNQVMQMVIPAMNAENGFLVSGPNAKTSTKIDAVDQSWILYLARINRVQDLTAFRCPALEYTYNANLAGMDSGELAKPCSEAYAMAYANLNSADRPTLRIGETRGGFDFHGTKYLDYRKGNLEYTVAPSMLALGGCRATVSSAGELVATAILDFAASKGGVADLHGGQTNLFFLDGHTESLGQSEMATKFYPYYTSSTDRGAKLISEDSWLDPNKN